MGGSTSSPPPSWPRWPEHRGPRGRHSGWPHPAVLSSSSSRPSQVTRAARSGRGGRPFRVDSRILRGRLDGRRRAAGAGSRSPRVGPSGPRSRAWEAGGRSGTLQSAPTLPCPSRPTTPATSQQSAWSWPSRCARPSCGPRSPASRPPSPRSWMGRRTPSWPSTRGGASCASTLRRRGWSGRRRRQGRGCAARSSSAATRRRPTAPTPLTGRAHRTRRGCCAGRAAPSRRSSTPEMRSSAGRSASATATGPRSRLPRASRACPCPTAARWASCATCARPGRSTRPRRASWRRCPTSSGPRLPSSTATPRASSTWTPTPRRPGVTSTASRARRSGSRPSSTTSST